MFDKNSPFATPVAPKRKGGLSDAAHAELQAAILDCRLAPGTNVSEVELSQRFAFGLAPVRAAVTRLAQAGWIAADGRRGSVVLPVSAAHLEDLRASRHCLEPALTAHPAPAPLAAELRLRATIHASGANKTGTADPRTMLHQERALMALIAECLAAPRMRRWLLDSWDLSLRADRYLDDSFGVRRPPLPLADLACALADGDESRGHSILRQMRDAFALRISRALSRSDAPLVSVGAGPRGVNGRKAPTIRSDQPITFHHPTGGPA